MMTGASYTQRPPAMSAGGTDGRPIVTDSAAALTRRKSKSHHIDHTKSRSGRMRSNAQFAGTNYLSKIPAEAPMKTIAEYRKYVVGRRGLVAMLTQRMGGRSKARPDCRTRSCRRRSLAGGRAGSRPAGGTTRSNRGPGRASTSKILTEPQQDIPSQRCHRIALTVHVGIVIVLAPIPLAA
jgi:hypothetical protein